MKFKSKLLQGTFIKRYKRFFADIKYKNKIITAHCPNSGSMMGLLNKGNDAWFSVSDNPKRKLKNCGMLTQVIRNHLIELCVILTNSKKIKTLNLTKIKNEEFDIENIISKCMASSNLI